MYGSSAFQPRLIDGELCLDGRDQPSPSPANPGYPSAQASIAPMPSMP